MKNPHDTRTHSAEQHINELLSDLAKEKKCSESKFNVLVDLLGSIRELQSSRDEAFLRNKKLQQRIFETTHKIQNTTMKTNVVIDELHATLDTTL